MSTVVILHAYSASNAGDGWLHQLTADLVNDAFGVNAAVDLYALHPDSFDRKFYAKSAFHYLGDQGLLRRVRRADVVLAIGGGYLRARGFRELAKFGAAHLPQLLLASLHGSKTVYLPQSVGPFPPVAAGLVRICLSRMRRVYVRDDVSMAFLRRRRPAERLPDLAALWVGSRQMEQGNRAASPSRPVWILRTARGVSLDDMRQWLDAVPGEVALQSVGYGNDDARVSRAALSSPQAQLRSLGEALVDLPSVVVSMRLHGALAAINAGVPAVHLSYERKGFGVFQDLGLTDYVVNAREATTDQLHEIVASVRRDPSVYWKALDEARPRLSSSRESLVHEIRKAVTTDAGA